MIRTLSRGLPVPLRRAAAPRSVMKYMSTHYDSQSGKHFQLSDLIHLHVIEKSESSKFPLVGSSQFIGVSAADKGSQEAALAVLAGMQSVPNTCCYIIDAFSVDVHTLQTVTANMCDAGCSRVILTDTSAAMAAVDDYDLTETVEAVLWNDVVGEPMSMRVGLRATSSDNWETLVEAALDLNVKHYDVSECGEGAPPLDSVRSMLKERSLDHVVSKQ
jgi:hypothetical protein